MQDTSLHGDIETTLNSNSFNEATKEWSGSFGYSGNPVEMVDNSPSPKLTKSIYSDCLQGV